MKKMTAFMLALVLLFLMVSEAFAVQMFFPPCSNYSGNSIVDALESIGEESSYTFRKQLAKANNIPNYTGSAFQNERLLSLLRAGSLRRPNSEYESATDELEENATPFTVMEVTVDTTIRQEASSKSAIVAHLDAGSFVLSTASVINSYNNLWYCVVVGQATGWIYSGKLKEHIHNYQPVQGSSEVTYCPCGAMYIPNDSNILHLSTEVATMAVTPEVLATLVTLGGFVTSALPFIAVGVVAAELIYLMIRVGAKGGTYTVTQATTTSWKKLDYEFKPSDDGQYYRGKTCKGFLLIDFEHPMDLDDSIHSLQAALDASRLTLSTSMLFIYTLQERDADILARTFCSTHYGYSYFVDSCHDKTQTLIWQFKHLHIVEDIEPANHMGIHILYDAPACGTYTAGAWSTKSAATA